MLTVKTNEREFMSQVISWLNEFLGAGTYPFELASSDPSVKVSDKKTKFPDVQIWLNRLAQQGFCGWELKTPATAVDDTELLENAAEKASLLTIALLDLKNKVVKRKSEIDVHPETGLSKMEARLNINMIKGGLKVNIVPDECLISIDRRLIPEEDVEDARKELIDTLSSVADVRWEIEKVSSIPTVSPCEDPIVNELSTVVRQVTGGSGKFGEMGSGDLPHIVAEWGGKEFSLGVIRSECNIHGKDEFVYQKDIEDLAIVISRFISDP